MKPFSQTPIIQSCYVANTLIQKIAAAYPINYRHTLGMRLALGAAELLTEILKTNACGDYAQRSSALLELRPKRFILGIEVRLGKDLKLISKQQHGQVHECLMDIRKQLCGWLKWTEKQS